VKNFCKNVFGGFFEIRNSENIGIPKKSNQWGPCITIYLITHSSSKLEQQEADIIQFPMSYHLLSKRESVFPVFYS